MIQGLLYPCQYNAHDMAVVCAAACPLLWRNWPNSGPACGADMLAYFDHHTPTTCPKPSMAAYLAGTGLPRELEADRSVAQCHEPRTPGSAR